MTNDYLNVTTLRAFLHDDSTLDATSMTSAITAASRDVDAYCHRHFYNTTSGVQYFYGDYTNPAVITFDDMDLATTGGLTVLTDTGYLGTYPTAWTSGTDYFLEPVNQSVDGIEGWPYTSMRALQGKVWPPRLDQWQRPTVKITGTWGWTAAPEQVTLATTILAGRYYKRGEAIFGTAGFDQFGAVRLRDDPDVCHLLNPFVKGGTGKFMIA